MSLRWLATANLGLGVVLAGLFLVAPPRSIAATCSGASSCEVTMLDRVLFALVPVLVSALFIGGALLLSRLSSRGARLVLALPPLVSLAFVVGLGGAALISGLQT